MFGLGTISSSPMAMPLRLAACLYSIATILLLPTTGAFAQSAQSPYLPLSYYQERGLLSKNGIAPRTMGLQPGESPYIPQTRVERLTESSHYTIDTRDTGEIINNSIRMSNVGTMSVLNPWVVLNNRKDWSSVSTLVPDVYQGETDPEKQAFRVWSFLKRNRYHWWPAEDGADVHDPIKLLNVYGYGFCDDVARCAEFLYRAGGFSDARMWWLDGHVVPEVYFGGAWHLFDSDTEVFYPKWDNRTAASVDDCANDGALVRRCSDEYVTSLYTSKSNNFISREQFSYSHTMDMRLRPGESIERYWYNWGKYHDLSYHTAPLHYGNGRITFEPPLADYSSSSFDQLDNLTIDDALGMPSVHLVSSSKPGIMEVRLAAPYVFVGGTIELNYSLKSSSDRIVVEFAKDYSPTLVGEIVGPASGSVVRSLDNFIDTMGSGACYLFGFRITMQGSDVTSAEINKLKITGDVQCSIISLPAVEPGKENDVAVRMAASADGALEVSHSYYKRIDGVRPPQRSAGPVFPPDRAIIDTIAPELKWKDEPASNVLARHEITVSWDPEGIIPVAPPLDSQQGPSQSYFSIPVGWLTPGKTYYWKVRACDSQGLFGDWSGPWNFTLSKDAAMPTPTQTPIASPTATPTPTPTATPRPEDLEITNINRVNYKIDVLEPGKLVYCDASDTFLPPIPVDLINNPYLMTYNSDKDQAVNNFLMFDVNQSVTVIIAVDETAPALPGWLYTWTKRRDQLRVSGTTARRNMFTKDFPRGQIILSGNSDTQTPQARSMYSVIVLPTLAGASGWQLYE